MPDRRNEPGVALSSIVKETERNGVVVLRRPESGILVVAMPDKKQMANDPAVSLSWLVTSIFPAAAGDQTKDTSQNTEAAKLSRYMCLMRIREYQHFHRVT